ncbi:flavin reductase family protein [Isoalcanivorax indicus]|uniref:flavin reductase family protein n=1 Tax=Isoalcanivorax indicus TaxID=2202653 RepID=UPI000DB92A3E|nr:flavin reductase [Isoalcanivorax indicus]
MSALTRFDPATMPQRHRARFVNALTGFKSANLVGTRDPHGRENLALFSSAVHLGADPALLGLISRPPVSERHTLENILSTGVFTLNQVHDGIIQAAHQTSARYPRDASEFVACGLTPWYSGTLDAPYVLESRLRLGLRLRETIPVTLNNTVLIIGEIVEVLTLASAVGEDGHIDITQLDAVAISGLDSYHRTQPLARYPYAKP